MATESRRHQEARTVARANRIAAVIRLCAGQMDSWDDFLKDTDAGELSRRDRRTLQLASAQARARTRELVTGFNHFFFRGATEAVFEALFRDIQAGIPVGLRMPISEFERRFAPLRREVEKGRDQNRPFHATISITLLGLKYEYPEWHFANDIVVALKEARELDRELGAFSRASELDPSLKRRWIEAEPLAKRRAATLRWCVTACSSLLESYLSGLAWRVQQTEPERLSTMPSKDRKAIEDLGPSFKDRLIRVPRVVTGRSLWDEHDADVQAVLTVKQARDALMHPSPFSVPEKYGGRDKLSLIYELQHEVVEKYVHHTVTALTRVCRHINGDRVPLPTWLTDLCTLADRPQEQDVPANNSMQRTALRGLMRVAQRSAGLIRTSGGPARRTKTSRLPRLSGLAKR